MASTIYIHPLLLIQVFSSIILMKIAHMYKIRYLLMIPDADSGIMILVPLVMVRFYSSSTRFNYQQSISQFEA